VREEFVFVSGGLESQQECAARAVVPGRGRRQAEGRRRKIRQRQTDCEIRDEVLAFFAGLYQMSVTRTNTLGLSNWFHCSTCAK
jgi:hypothetical protein